MKRFALGILLLLTLCGCVHYDEELWLHRDGSGKAKIRIAYRSPYENTEEILRKAALPGVSLVSYNVRRKGQDVIYDVTFKFKDIESFNNINDQLGTADFWGKITLNKEPGRRITFKRRIALGSQDNTDEMESLFSNEQNESHAWNYKLHVPWKITDTNALPSGTNVKGRTLTWSYDTAKMWNTHEYMTAEFRKDLPWFVFVLGFVALALVFYVFFWLWKISRGSHYLDRIRQRL